MSTYQEERFPLPTPGRLARELRLGRPPWWMVAALAALVILALIPLVWIVSVRGRQSSRPKVHFILDMDQQPRFGPQASHPGFADGRAMRQPVEGTVARGRLESEDHFYRGYRELVTDDGIEIRYFESLPEQLDVQSLIARGKDRFAIFCATCHGDRGRGDGPVNRRAVELEEQSWVPAMDLHSAEARALSDGQVFRTIGEGIRNMPPHKSQLDERDRWAIVAYLRRLQSAASPEENAVPSNGLPSNDADDSNGEERP